MHMTTPKLLLLLACLMAPTGSRAQTVPAAPARQAPIAIDRLLTPEIGGIRQYVEIRTDDASKPVLLMLSGGPGSSMMNNAAAYTTALKETYTIVQWDQRDAGKTLALNRSPAAPTLAQMQDDTRQVIEFVRTELRQEKIYLLGSSWGNVLGFHIVAKYPQLLHAYIAVNPVVSQLASEKALLATLQAHFRHNPEASKELASVSIPFKVDEDLFYLRKWLLYKEGKDYALGPDFKSGFMAWSRTWSSVWNEVMGIDLPRTLTRADCPVYFLVGKQDIQTSTSITSAYAAQLAAPAKALFVFEHSGHQIHKDEADKFQSTVNSLVDARPAQR